MIFLESLGISATKSTPQQQATSWSPKGGADFNKTYKTLERGHNKVHSIQQQQQQQQIWQSPFQYQ